MFFVQHPLLKLVLCKGWAWRCVLMRAVCFLLTSSFGTDAVFWLGLTLFTDGNLCFFSNILFWHWCCVLVGLDYGITGLRVLSTEFLGLRVLIIELRVYGCYSLNYGLRILIIEITGLRLLINDLFKNIICWHWCCVLGGFQAVY